MMLTPRNEEIELRELCVSLAVQAGAKEGRQIVDLAEALRRYIQFGTMAGRGSASETSHPRNGIGVDELSAENDI
jgi:hypothetical protein